jgi:hypothetical protein
MGKKAEDCPWATYAMSRTDLNTVSVRYANGSGYYNVKMLLFRPFLNHYTSRSQSKGQARRQSHGRRSSVQDQGHAHPALSSTGNHPDEFTSTPPSTSTSDILITQVIRKCLDAAERTIAVMHDIYRLHTFFRCWYARYRSFYPLSPC